MEDIERKVIKLAMLGDSSVGKTSICYVLINLDFQNELLATIGQDKIEYQMKMEDGKEMKVLIWDTAGQERFHSIALKACRNAQGIVIVFDLTNKKSFLNVVNWLKDIKENFKSPSLILLGNKCDLTEKRTVSKKEAEDFAKEHNLIYFETSARQKININASFEKLANEVYKRYDNTKSGISLKSGNKVKKKGCCGGGNEKKMRKSVP